MVAYPVKTTLLVSCPLAPNPGDATAHRGPRLRFVTSVHKAKSRGTVPHTPVFILLPNPGYAVGLGTSRLVHVASVGVETPAGFTDIYCGRNCEKVLRGRLARVRWRDGAAEGPLITSRSAPANHSPLHGRPTDGARQSAEQYRYNRRINTAHARCLAVGGVIRYKAY